VSHEFRTPLTTLCQLSELLMRVRVASDDDRRQYYALLHNESQRLGRLVEALLNFGRIEAGRMQFRFEPVNPVALTREVVEEFSRTEQGATRSIDVHADTEQGLVSADRELLRSVVWNLLENAAKYSPNDSTIWVDVQQIDAYVTVKVRDQGVAIPPSEQARIFETFVRGTAARASDIRGTGVGLAVAQRIVHAHGGDILVESQLGRGSTFSIVLPVRT